MRKQNRNITVKPGNFTKEELLGFTSKAFQLEQSEYVAKKIIDQLLFLTFDKVRKISSPFSLFQASLVFSTLMVYTYKRAENFSVLVLTFIFPQTMSPVFRLYLRIWDGDTYTSFSPGR